MAGQSRFSFGGSLDRLASQVSSVASSLQPGKSKVDDSNNSDASRFFAIRIVDADTHRGVPLVYLRTTFRAIYVTDSAGYVAFCEPGLMAGAEVWLTISSYGYETPIGFLDVAGTQVRPVAGGSVVIKLKRSQISERLYRLTGYGIYRDSVLLGRQVPIREPLLNAQVAGSDTIQCARFQGKLMWMWQDTDQIKFGLGNFAMTGATTALPEHLDPDQGLSFDYFTEDRKPTSFARSMVDISLPNGISGPIWVDGLTVVPDHHGRERLVARYYVSGQTLGECLEEGLVLWNDSKEVLERLVKFENKEVLYPNGHTIYIRDNGVRYAYYGRNVRVRAEFASASDPTQYEAFTCLSHDGTQARRNRDGKLQWGWEKGGRLVNFETARGLVDAGIIAADESPYDLHDIDSGQAVTVSTASIAWSPFLQTWVNIVQQHAGDTFAGEIWFCTANAPEGPWKHCRKVATHYMDRDEYKNNHNDFYNPVLHSELSTRDGGRWVYFSGTLVNTFSGNTWSTPYYNYNNIMHRLDLQDPRLGLPPPRPGLWPTVADHD